MKTLTLLAVLFMVGTLGFAQNEKCLKYTKSIITAANLKTVAQTTNYTKAVFQLKYNYNLESVMEICDTTIKSKPSYGWRINSDKNDEREYMVDGRKLLITIYWKDEFVYFEY